jgi:cytochrome b561
MKYPLSSRVIHWLMALLIIFMLGLGNYMGFIAKDSPNRMEIYSLHKSLGVVALIFIFIRIINLLFKKPPALPTTMNKIEITLAHLGHLSLYLLMIVVPLSGYLMSNSSGYPVHLFAIEMPILMSANFKFAALFHEVHEISANLLILVLAFHILAVIKHRFFDKAENDVLKRML